VDDQRTNKEPTGSVRAVGEEPTAPAPQPQAQAVDPLIGQTLAGRYCIERKLGEGGMGAVYLATHNVLEKQVALKILHVDLVRKPDLVERFMQEAKAASRIRHENVIDISDFGTTPEGLVFFAMELLTGHDLHDEIARARIAGELLPWSRSKHIFLQICAALSAAHRRGIIHRDMKPENVYLVDFLGDPDFVKLLDFGIAKLTESENGERKLTRTGMLFGTPEYMSPEQARGEPVDHRIDIYAMGCILFQLVTGRVPFESSNFMSVLTLHLTEPPPTIPDAVFDRIGAPRELAGVIEQAIAKDRTLRFQTIDDLANAVRAVCGEAPVLSGASGPRRAPSVPSPGETMHRVTPVPGPMPTPVPSPMRTPVPSVTPTPVPAAASALPVSLDALAAGASGVTLPAVSESAESAASASRSGTQWTGRPSVPRIDEPPPARSRSKLPLVLGAIALAGGLAAGVVITTRGGFDGGGATAGSAEAGSAASATDGSGSAAGAVAGSAAAAAGSAAAGSAIAAAGSADTGSATAAAGSSSAPVPPPPEEAPLPEKVMVTLDSQPRGAIVKDLVSGVVFGPTPRTFRVTPSHKPRQYLLTLRGHADAQVELVPDREKIEHTEPLEKSGGGGKPGRGKPDAGKPDAGKPDSGKPDSGKPDSGKPDPGKPDPGTPQAKPPGGGTPPPPVDDCPELPCLKSDPTRRGSGAPGGGGGS
jgi:serine/threonine protein kinase